MYTKLLHKTKKLILIANYEQNVHIEKKNLDFDDYPKKP